jgi:hypothetical protein
MTTRRNSAELRSDQIARSDDNERAEQPGSVSRAFMPRRGTIWIPSSAIVCGALPLPAQGPAADLDRTMW